MPVPAYPAPRRLASRPRLPYIVRTLSKLHPNHGLVPVQRDQPASGVRGRLSFPRALCSRVVPSDNKTVSYLDSLDIAPAMLPPPRSAAFLPGPAAML